ncbi:MAG TPA: hypothetical protein VGQ38_15385 [Gaiellaceae bacterium]|jgi:hypothetical protein|nr:hypothetical protein [Gaiellaceae bacterium]
MPNNYNGSATDADFTTPPGIVLDGEVWQFGDPTSGSGGHFALAKAALDRLAYLKAHSAFADLNNTFSGVNTFNANVHIDNNSTLDVRSGSTAKIDSGGIFQAVSGSNVSISSPGLGNVSITADFLTALFTNPTNAAIALQGPFVPSGSHAIQYCRTPTIVSASGHIDCTEDIWRVADSLSGNITLQVDAPPDPTKTTILKIVRSPQADTHQVTLQNGTGTSASATTFAVANGTGAVPPDGRWLVELEWSTGLNLWRIFNLSGDVESTLGAE